MALAAICGAIAAAPAMATTLTTPLAGGNGQSGIMFDIASAGSALRINALGVSLNGTHTIEVYTRPGTVVGNLGPAGWTLINTFTGVTGGGIGTVTNLDITDFVLDANSVLGLYITGLTPNEAIVNYTNGSAVGATVASDGFLTIRSGFGRSYAFEGSFSPRNFNGSITYTPGIPEPATWAMLIAGFGLVGAVARRRAAALTA